ncbi:MAG: hypothetical protein K2Q07_07100, partial [Burkholderiaceae bacterium]|nr:hypothetical protein [Burkholderiaceae bacterium]
MDTLSSPIDPVQSADLATGACADKSAYLIVQVESPEHRGRRGPHASTPLQRLRALCSPAAPSTDETLSLTLSDARGHTVLSLPNATPVLGIALVP